MPTIGLFGLNMGACATPEGAAGAAALAEELGYDSIWLGEHVVAPSPRVPPSPVEPDYPLLDPVVTLAFMAAATQRVLLATGIVILPQRNPLVLAKELASLDVLSSGRLVFGLGVGYLEPEMSAVGVPMEGRGTRADEHLAAMRSLWEDEAPAFHGSHVEFEGVDAYPRPVQRPVPVVVGGHTRAAHRRAVRHAQGWYGFALDRAATESNIGSLREEARAAGRDPGELTITVSPSERLDTTVVEDYAELGVDRLAVLPPARFSASADYTLADLEDHIRAHAPARLGATTA
ncbi:MAG TPA: TIGR03619 family F420-dependent LLM class oxidoreductase [Thermoleophilaceae bacterium]